MNMRSTLVLVCWPFLVSPSFAGDREIAELCDRLETVQKASGIPGLRHMAFHPYAQPVRG